MTSDELLESFIEEAARYAPTSEESLNRNRHMNDYDGEALDVALVRSWLDAFARVAVHAWERHREIKTIAVLNAMTQGALAFRAMGEPLPYRQTTKDALLVDFINYVASRRGVDYALYTTDIQSEPEKTPMNTQGPTTPANDTPPPDFATEDEAKAAASAFLDEVSALRGKYGLHGLVLAVAMNVQSDKPEGGSLTTLASHGNPVTGAVLAASLYGAFARPMLDHARHISALAGLRLDEDAGNPILRMPTGILDREEPANEG